MLVLSRHEREEIVIDGVIRVRVIQILGDKVRLGIDAPVEVPVHCEEIWAKIQQQLNHDCTQDSAGSES